MYSLNRIINQVSKEIFDEGEKYYSQSKIRNVHTYSTRTKFFVESEKVYHVEIEMISLNEQDKARSIYCSCDKFSHGNYCSHIIATILYLKNNNLERIKSLEKKEDLVELSPKKITVLEFVDKLKEKKMNSKKRININYFLDLSNGVDIGIRINGLEKISITDLSKKINFFNSDQKKLKLSDSFTFDKNKHYISEGDLKNIKILELLPSLKEKSSTDFRSVPPELLLKILKQMDYSKVTVLINNEVYEGVYCYFDETLLFTLDYIDKKIIFKSNFMENAKTYKYGPLIIKFNKNSIGFIEKYNNLLKIFNGSETGEVIIDEIDFQKFINTVFEERFEHNIQLTENILSIVKPREYRKEILLMKDKKSIVAKIKMSAKKNKDHFTLRDDAQKKKIYNRIKESLLEFGFNFSEKKYYLSSEKLIFNFFREGINELEKKGIKVFYTQKLKKYYNKCQNIKITINENSIKILDLKVTIDKFNSEEMNKILSGIMKNEKYIRLKGDRFIDLTSDNIIELSNFLKELDFNESDSAFHLNKFRGIEAFNRLNFENIEVIDNDNIQGILKKIMNFDNESVSIDFLGDKLREYQKNGVRWMKSLEKCDLCGILADEMGLGKTVQVISLLGNSNKKSIIIVPSSLMFNWKREFEKFNSKLSVKIISGSPDEREDLIKNISDFDVAITSYPLIRRDYSLYKEYEFDYCILDEGQYIKNPDTITARAVKSIRAKNRLILTGTPLENNLLEIWSMFDFILPGYLGNLSSYRKKFIKDKKNHNKLIRLIHPFILRRKKNDVLSELPEKIINVVYAEMEEEQKSIYNSFLLESKKRLIALKEKNEINKSKIEILSILTRLRQICCHPGLFIEEYSKMSGKMKLIEELVEELLEGKHKILIFSQFTSMLKKIKALLDKKNINTSYLDGQIPVKNRENIINEFVNGENDIFLISLKVGGTGLNLTEADTVIHVDPWWNPAVEDQATDRAHRIGQKDVVNVYKILTQDSIEEKIFEIQQSKRRLIEKIIDDEPLEKFSSDEICEVLNEIVR